MLDQNTFRETLHLVQRVAASSDQPMSREEALSYFQDMELSPEQQELVYRFLLQRAGDQAVIGEISQQWLQRIVTMAREYQRDGFYLDDLVQEGNLALLTALHELLGCQEEQELEKRLVEAVMDGIEQYMGLESGAQQQEETILAKVTLLHEARELLKAQSGEEPSVKQLMDYTRLTVQEISDIMDLMEKANR